MERDLYKEHNDIRGFDRRLKSWILSYGGVFGELILTNMYDFTGKRIACAKGKKMIVKDEGGEKTYKGHAVVIIGWKNYGSTVHYRYLNSYGSSFGEGGLVRAKLSIMHTCHRY